MSAALVSSISLAIANPAQFARICGQRNDRLSYSKLGSRLFSLGFRCSKALRQPMAKQDV